MKFQLTKYDASQKTEILFLLKLSNALPDCYRIKKTPERFCCVDYTIFLHDESLLYLEYKHRGNLRIYNSFMIGAVKLNRIALLDLPTILVWYCETDQLTYFKLFEKQMLKLEQHVCNGSCVYFIDKADTTTGFERLIHDIQSYDIYYE